LLCVKPITCRAFDVRDKRTALDGSLFEQTVLTDATTDMVITKEETFGPVAPL